MTHNCPHCGKPINPASMMGSVKSPKKEAAAKANGERLRKMYANARKLDVSPIQVPVTATDIHSIGVPLVEKTPEELRDMVIPPKPTTLEEKKAAAMAALVGLKNHIKAGGSVGHLERELHDTPCAPFDVNLEGEPHRVTQSGKRLALYYLGGGEPVLTRFLQQGELEKFWEARIR